MVTWTGGSPSNEYNEYRERQRERDLLVVVYVTSYDVSSDPTVTEGENMKMLQKSPWNKMGGRKDKDDQDLVGASEGLQRADVYHGSKGSVSVSFKSDRWWGCVAGGISVWVWRTSEPKTNVTMMEKSEIT